MQKRSNTNKNQTRKLKKRHSNKTEAMQQK